MWIIFFGSVAFAVAAFVKMSGRKEAPSDKPDKPSKPDDDDTDDDDRDDSDDSDEGEPETDKHEPDDDDDNDDPDDYDDADVYYNVDQGKKKARRARVPVVKS